MIDDKDLWNACAKEPGFTEGTAYFRTKVLCGVLSKRGVRIPGWDKIRQIIGKGSPGDINNAVKDFRHDLAKQLLPNSNVPEGVPQLLAPQIQSFWDAAVRHVNKQFEAKEAHWEQHIERAESELEQMAEKLAEAQAISTQLQNQLSVELATIDGLKIQLQAQIAAKAQLEEVYLANKSEMNAQREKLEAVIQKNEESLETAFIRFDGERKHAMVQIAEARERANKEIEQLKALHQTETDANQLSLARANQRINELSAKMTETQQENILLTEKLKSFSSQKKMAMGSFKKTRLFTLMLNRKI